MKDIGSRLRSLRESRDLSQHDVAAGIGVARQALSRLETGDTYPEIKTAQKLATFFNISLDWLITGKEFGDTISQNGSDISNSTVITGKQISNTADTECREKLKVAQDRIISLEAERDRLFQIVLNLSGSPSNQQQAV